MPGEALLAQLSQLFEGQPTGGLSFDFLLSDRLLVLEVSALVFFIFFPLFVSTWTFWRNELFKKSIKWLLLEIKIPREIKKSPKAMEQVLSAIHALRNAPGDIRERYWDGEVTRWYSFEMVSFGGEVRFFLRLYYKQRDLVESAFFSYYKDVELVEVEDYVDEKFPKTVQELYSWGYDMWGSEMLLSKEAAYPIKSYADFEAIEEEKQFDPISNFIEVLAKAKKEEIVGVQILAAPAAHDWHKKWEPFVQKLMKVDTKQQRAPTTVIDFHGGPLPAFSTSVPKKDEFAGLTKAFTRTPGETDALKAVERNLSKPAFDSLIRFIYFSPKSMFYDSYARRGLTGAFNQYASLDMNSFIQNYDISTRTRIWNKPYIFPKWRNEFRKQRLLLTFSNRKLPTRPFMGKLLTSYIWNWNIHSKTFELNTESLATLFHPPTWTVLTAPHMKRLESRKTGPPAGLAIFGDEEKIEQFK